MAGDLASQLLLACVPARLEPARLRGLATDPRMDWAAAYRLADRHGVVGLIAPQLHETCDGALPDQVWAPWRRRWQALAMQDLTHLAMLEHLLEESHARGLRPLLLKGLAVHLQAYPREMARGAADIDLLVDRSDIAPMAQCLEAAGFVLAEQDAHGRPVANVQTLLAKDSEALFVHPTRNIDVDLHWDLCAFRVAHAVGLRLTAHLGDRARALPVGRAVGAIPGREEELLVLSLHLLGEGDFVLRNLCDLARLLVAEPPVDWPRFCRVAGETGTDPVAFYALTLVEQASPGVVPSAVWSTLAPAAGPRRLLAPFLQMDTLLNTRGEGIADVGTFWQGVLFARHPWRWLPCQTVRVGRWMARRAHGMLR